MKASSLYVYLCCAVLSHSVVSDSVTLCTVADQATMSMGILQARILKWVAIPPHMYIHPEITMVVPVDILKLLSHICLYIEK